MCLVAVTDLESNDCHRAPGDVICTGRLEGSPRKTEFNLKNLVVKLNILGNFRVTFKIVSHDMC